MGEHSEFFAAQNDRGGWYRISNKKDSAFFYF